MIIYVKETQKTFFSRFKALKIENREKKNIIYLPIANQNVNKTNLKKLNKFIYDNRIKYVVLEKNLMQNEELKNNLYSNNIQILDGTRLSRFLLCTIIQKVYDYKNKKIESGEITLLIHEKNEINLENIKKIAQKVKRLNIITDNLNKFKKIRDYLYEELGILIKISSNIKFNLESTDVIANIDFSEKEINNLRIPTNAIIVSMIKNINITSKRFAGVNIRDWKLNIPKEYKLEGFSDNSIYEAHLLNQTNKKIFEAVMNDNITINEFIGMNGIINRNEFV